jgi:hypothetical protein
VDPSGGQVNAPEDAHSRWTSFRRHLSGFATGSKSCAEEQRRLPQAYVQLERGRNRFRLMRQPGRTQYRPRMALLSA